MTVQGDLPAATRPAKSVARSLASGASSKTGSGQDASAIDCTDIRPGGHRRCARAILHRIRTAHFARKGKKAKYLGDIYSRGIRPHRVADLQTPIAARSFAINCNSWGI
jgi:hypothetical protein